MLLLLLLLLSHFSHVQLCATHTVVACIAGYLIALLYHSMGWI